MTGTDANSRPEHAYATDSKKDGRSAKRRKLDPWARNPGTAGSVKFTAAHIAS